MSIPLPHIPASPLASWRTLLRDVGVALVLLFLAVQLFNQAEQRQPAFSAADIRVIEGPIAEFTTVRVPETAAAPQRNSSTIRARPAMRLAADPPNLLSYIPGSGWNLEADIPLGTVVRLEVTENPDELLARARDYPDATFQQKIAGLQIGDHVYFRAIDSLHRAEDAASRYQRLGLAALAAALVWIGRVGWSRRRVLHAIRDKIRGA